MGWRAKVAAVVVLGAGLGGGVLYLTDYKKGPRATVPPSSYVEAVSIKLESGEPIQLRLSRCDLGAAGSRLILKVYGQVTNLGREEVARRQYTFALRDGHDRVYGDEAPVENPDANSFSLRPGESREFVLKFFVEPISFQSALRIVSIKEGGQSSPLLQVKAADPLDLTLRDGEWRAFREPRWANQP